MTTSCPHNVILESSSDWVEWMIVIRCRATVGEVFKYIDPSQDSLPPQLEKPAEITPQQISASLTDFANMTDRQERLYRILLARYEQQMTAYYEKKNVLINLTTFITQSIARHYLLYIEKEDTVWGMLAALKRRLAPTGRVRELEVTGQYRALQSLDKDQKIEKWLQDWERTFAEAVSLDLPDVQHDRSLDDFLNAIRAVYPGFADTKSVILEGKRIDGQTLPALPDLLDQFRNYVRITRANITMLKEEKHDWNNNYNDNNGISW